MSSLEKTLSRNTRAETSLKGCGAGWSAGKELRFFCSLGTRARCQATTSLVETTFYKYMLAAVESQGDLILFSIFKSASV